MTTEEQSLAIHNAVKVMDMACCELQSNLDLLLSDLRAMQDAKNRLAKAFGLWHDGKPKAVCGVEECESYAIYSGPYCWDHREDA